MGGGLRRWAPHLVKAALGRPPKLVKVQDTESQIREGVPIGKWKGWYWNEQLTTHTPFVSKTVSSFVGLVLDYFSIVQKHHQVTGIIWINALSSHHGNLDPPRHHKADRNYVKTASRLLSVQITPGAVALDVFSEKRTKWCWNVINDNSSDCWGEQKDAKLTLLKSSICSIFNVVLLWLCWKHWYCTYWDQVIFWVAVVAIGCTAL